MSSTAAEDAEMETANEGAPQDHHKDDDDDKHIEEAEPEQKNEDHPTPSPQQEVETLKKKYGGLLPKKPPLISKDHEHAFFDSADWALGKQGAQKAKGPLEALRPKLQPTPHHHARPWRCTYAPPDDEDVVSDNSVSLKSEDHACFGDDGKNATASREREGTRSDPPVNP